MNARELLAVIRAAGGAITLLDSAIEAELPSDVSHLIGQVEHNRDSIRAVIESEQPGFLQSCFQPSAKLDGRKLKKIVRTIQDQGGEFAPAGSLFLSSLPDELMRHENAIRTNALEIAHLLWPAVKSSRKKRAKCEICNRGQGCCTRGGEAKEEACPKCGHGCAYHFLAEIHELETFPGGCRGQVKIPGADHDRCRCSGWPATLKPPKDYRWPVGHPFSRRSKSPEEDPMGGLIPQAELERNRQKYLSEQAQLEAECQSQRPKTRAEILVEIAREDPTLTIAELSMASDRSVSWVRRALKAAGYSRARNQRAKPERRSGFGSTTVSAGCSPLGEQKLDSQMA
jgi:hypothetical protein